LAGTLGGKNVNKSFDLKVVDCKTATDMADEMDCWGAFVSDYRLKR